MNKRKRHLTFKVAFCVFFVMFGAFITSLFFVDVGGQGIFGQATRTSTNPCPACMALIQQGVGANAGVACDNLSCASHVSRYKCNTAASTCKAHPAPAGDSTDAGTEGPLDVGKILGDVIVKYVMPVCLAAVILWCVWVGIQFAKASDEGKRHTAKKQFINACATVLIFSIISSMLLVYNATYTPRYLPETINLSPSDPNVGGGSGGDNMGGSRPGGSGTGGGGLGGGSVTPTDPFAGITIPMSSPIEYNASAEASRYGVTSVFDNTLIANDISAVYGWRRVNTPTITTGAGVDKITYQWEPGSGYINPANPEKVPGLGVGDGISFDNYYVEIRAGEKQGAGLVTYGGAYTPMTALTSKLEFQKEFLVASLAGRYPKMTTELNTKMGNINDVTIATATPYLFEDGTFMAGGEAMKAVGDGILAPATGTIGPSFDFDYSNPVNPFPTDMSAIYPVADGFIVEVGNLETDSPYEEAYVIIEHIDVKTQAKWYSYYGGLLGAIKLSNLVNKSTFDEMLTAYNTNPNHFLMMTPFVESVSDEEYEIGDDFGPGGFDFLGNWFSPWTWESEPNAMPLLQRNPAAIGGKNRYLTAVGPTGGVPPIDPPPADPTGLVPSMCTTADDLWFPPSFMNKEMSTSQSHLTEVLATVYTALERTGRYPISATDFLGYVGGGVLDPGAGQIRQCWVDNEEHFAELHRNDVPTSPETGISPGAKACEMKHDTDTWNDMDDIVHGGLNRFHERHLKFGILVDADVDMLRKQYELNTDYLNPYLVTRAPALDTMDRTSATALLADPTLSKYIRPMQGGAKGTSIDPMNHFVLYVLPETSSDAAADSFGTNATTDALRGSAENAGQRGKFYFGANSPSGCKWGCCKFSVASASAPILSTVSLSLDDPTTTERTNWVGGGWNAECVTCRNNPPHPCSIHTVNPPSGGGGGGGSTDCSCPSEQTGIGNELTAILVDYVFPIATGASVLWCLWVGWHFATAKDEGARQQSKSRFIKAFATVFIIAVLYLIMGVLSLGFESPGKNHEEDCPNKSTTISFTRNIDFPVDKTK